MGSLVGLECRDPHFCHDFEHALGNTLAIRGHNLVLCGKRLWVQQAVEMCLLECFECEIRVNGSCAVTNQQAVVVDFPSFAGFHHQPDATPFGLADEMVVYRAARQ